MMKGGILVVVPSTVGMTELDVLAGTSFVVLEDVLMSGLAGLYFRRLYLQMVLDPARRVEYESMRSEYLKRVLLEKEFAADTVFVGTRATDVDLADFSMVYSVRVSDRGLRAMSKVVYGDPILLYMEFMCVLTAVENAVDLTVPVADWSELPMVMMRMFPGREYADPTLHVSRQRVILTHLLSGREDAQVWLEDSVYRSGTEKRTFFVADYDYLSFIRPIWRDSVVRLMGKAPSVTEVFKLPWCVVDTAALSSVCYRPNIHGFPTATARGFSLIEFVRTRLAGSMTTREMVGTWVGGLLCDDLTAVDTIAALGDKPLVVGAVVPVAEVRRPGTCSVPVEYAWMYEAVGGVNVVPWDGPRALDGSLVLASLGEQWVHSLPLAELFSCYAGNAEMAVAVVQFFMRLHRSGVTVEFVHKLLLHARELMSGGCTPESYDPVMTPMVPGYEYLMVFLPSVRLSAVQILGCSPGVAVAMAHAARQGGVDGFVSPEQLLAELSRTKVFAGSVYASVGVVGHGFGAVVAPEEKPCKPGYCYVCLFKPKHRKSVERIMGGYPAFQKVMRKNLTSWYVRDALDRVRVTQGLYVDRRGVSTPVLHFSLDGGGPTLREFVRYASSSRSVVAGLRQVKVGQPGVCYSSTWYVAAIIAWTIVGCALFAVLSFFTYRRCIGGGGSGGRRRGGY